MHEVIESSPRVEDPGFKVKLYPHQLALIYAMLEFEGRCRISYVQGKIIHKIRANTGFLTDHLGSGKTLTALGLIASKGEDTEFIYKDVFFGLSQSTKSRIFCYVERSKEIKDYVVNTTLIVVPKHLKDTVWAEDLKKTNLKYGEASKFYTYSAEELQRLDAILCDQDTYNDFLLRHDYTWRRVFVDEMDTSPMGNMREPACKFLWVISGTACNLSAWKGKSGLVGNYSYMPQNMIEALSFRSSNTFYKTSVKVENFEIVSMGVYGIKPIEYLKGAVSERNERLIAENNVSQVAQKLSGSVYITDHKMTNLVYIVYEMLERMVDEYRVEGKKRYAQAVERLSAIKGNILKLDVFPCYACNNRNAHQPVLLAPCHHTICRYCADRYTPSLACPICTESIDENCCVEFVEGTPQLYMVNVDGGAVASPDRPTINPKISFIIDKLRSSEIKNMLIFSTKSSQKIIYDALKKAKMNPRLLSPGRLGCLELMRSGKVKVICADGGSVIAGLNLPFVDSIAIYDDLVADNLKQAIGRGQRVGRTKKLKVYMLA